MLSERYTFPRILPEISFTMPFSSMDDINLSFTRGALEAIAERALKMGTGARGLRNIMERVMRDTMFDAPSTKHSGITTDVVVTETMVRERTRIYHGVG